MPEDVEELPLALVDLVLVPLSIPAWGDGSRVQRVGLLPLLVLLPLVPCYLDLSETHTLRLTVQPRTKPKYSVSFRSTNQSVRTMPIGAL
jgi:hypothetical protein